MLRRICIYVLGAFLAALLACTPAKSSRSKGSDAPYDFKSEGRIPKPAKETPAAPDVEELTVDENAVESEEAEPPPPPPAPPARETGPGFRIQVFASGAEDVAESARKSAEQRLGVPAYVVLVDGLYKVRVGDFRTREAAETFLATAREGFYTDAWIVESEVFYD